MHDSVKGRKIIEKESNLWVGVIQCSVLSSSTELPSFAGAPDARSAKCQSTE